VRSLFVAVAIALIIFAAVHHPASKKWKIIGATIASLGFIALTWQPIWNDFHNRNPNISIRSPLLIEADDVAGKTQNAQPEANHISGAPVGHNQNLPAANINDCSPGSSVDAGNKIGGAIIGIMDMTGRGCEINNTIDAQYGIIHTTPLPPSPPQGPPTTAKKSHN
jgi:hypothetical protein